MGIMDIKVHLENARIQNKQLKDEKVIEVYFTIFYHSFLQTLYEII